MGITKSEGSDEFMDDDFEDGDEATAFDEQEQESRASWRNVEDYMEKRRLKRYLSEFYDED